MKRTEQTIYIYMKRTASRQNAADHCFALLVKIGTAPRAVADSLAKASTGVIGNLRRPRRMRITLVAAAQAEKVRRAA